MLIPATAHPTEEIYLERFLQEQEADPDYIEWAAKWARIAPEVED